MATCLQTHRLTHSHTNGWCPTSWPYQYRQRSERSLGWIVLTYGAEGWTLKKTDEKKDRISRTIVGCYGSARLNTEQMKVSSQSLTPPDSF